jgi:hypothetical protein
MLFPLSGFGVMRLARELASAAVAITASAIVGALIGVALNAVGDAMHPYAVVIACAAFGAVGGFVVLGRPPSQRLAVDLLLAVNVAAFVVLYGRAVPWAMSVGLLAGDAYYVMHALRAHRATVASR